MKISEKQLMLLIYIAESHLRVQSDNQYKQDIAKLLDQIANQQSTELKEVTDEQR